MQALKASLPALSACLHVAASLRDERDLGPLSGPSALVKRVGATISKLLHNVSHGANRRLLVHLGEAPGLSLIPPTGNTSFDAWLLVHLLTESECTVLLKSLLEWHNGLRVCLAVLLNARKAAVQVCARLAQDCFKLTVASLAQQLCLALRSLCTSDICIWVR
jgi:hypothetical protein